MPSLFAHRAPHRTILLALAALAILITLISATAPARAGGDAVRIDGIDFDVADRSEVERLVLLDAVDDARATADAIAAHIGMTVLGAVEIAVTSSLSPVTRTNAVDREEAAADDSFALLSSPVFSGPDTIVARVSVIYRLGPAGSTADENGEPAGAGSAGRE